METACQRTLWAGLRANCFLGLRQRANFDVPRCRRTFTSTSSLHASKSKKPAPKKAQSLPREYKTRARKPPPQPSYPSSSQSPPKSNPLRYRSIPIVLGSITLFALSGYCTYLYVYLSRPPPTTIPTSPSSQPDVSSRYNAIASTFDSSVDLNEIFMRMPRLRRKLASQAKGDVLEVAVGTGRNLEYYDWDFKGYNGVGKMGSDGIKRGKVRSFTAVDKSAEMLEIAHDKFAKAFPGIVGVRWIIADAEEEGKIPAPPRNSNERSGILEGGKYDTVIQTMGLCSVGDPVKLLQNLGDVVKEEDGRILLLEHGRGTWDWMNGILDRFAENHAKEFGCWWNRDLGRIIEDSGLEIVEIRRPWWHGGTTWWIELRKPISQPLKNEVGTDRSLDQQQDAEQSKKRGWW